MSNTTQVASATIQTVTFNNQEIPTIFVDGVPYVGMKPIAENIGLDWRAQLKRIQRHEVLNSSVSMIDTVGSHGKTRKMLCLPITMLNGWLFGVDVNRVKPAIKDTLIQYQKECFQTLYEHFHNIPKQYAEPQHNEQSFFLSTTQAREFDAMMRGLNDLARLVSRNNTDAAKIFMNRARDMNKYLVKHDRNNN